MALAFEKGRGFVVATLGRHVDLSWYASVTRLNGCEPAFCSKNNFVYHLR